ncbi:neutral amino acid permease [Fusarium albosuccineum]|uniref:Neutral amino acid permease n=1 Tax=Fusarium albosuccineum TaxID=1237068 RepID=A0A8H4PFF9_9HYPO|nr:neutral amino acid permease [Fusarium albosuccineum]
MASLTYFNLEGLAGQGVMPPQRRGDAKKTAPIPKSQAPDQINTKKPTPDAEKTNDPGHDEVDFKAAPHEEVGDNIFGGENGEGYRNMGRWDTLFALVTNQLGLGILSLPACLKILGIIPGLIAIVTIGILTWYSGILLHQFYCKHPHVVNMVDMVGVMGGRRWEIVAAVGILIQLLMTCASSAITLSVILNTISEHAMCTVGFIGVGALIIWLFCLPRTIKFVSQSGVPCFLSIIIASLIVIISLGVNKPTQAPEGWKADIVIATSPDFKQVFNACLRVFFAYAGNVAYCSYMAEMRDPVRDFSFGLTWLFGVSIVVYSTVAIAIYCLAGEFTTSPALGSAPLVFAKAAYGVIIPAVLTTGLSNGHIGIKYIYIAIMRWMKITNEITSSTPRSWIIWISCATVFWILCFILSNAIPIFDSILSISSCTTYAWTAWGVSAFF